MTATVAELTAWIEAQFPIGPPTSTCLSVTGEPYVVIGHMRDIPKTAGVIEEGSPRVVAFDEETACFSARSAFSQYAEDRTGTLYWRSKPSLEWSPKAKRCLVYMRLLISDKSHLPAPKEA